ncbi:MAG: ATP-binding protein [Bacteroidota bacterium]
MQIPIKYLGAFILSVFFQTVVCQKSIKDFYAVSNEQFNTGKYVEALNTNLEALKIVERTNSCLDIAYGNMQVGRMYYYLKDKRLALNTFFVAKKYIDSCGIDSLKHKVYHNIGAMYVELGKADSALLYLNKSLTILSLTKRYTELARINSVIADLHISITFNIKEAEKFVCQAEKFAELSGDMKETIFAKIKRGGLYRRQNLLNKAFVCYGEALQSYEKMNYIEGRLYMLKSSADVLALNGNPQALHYYNRFYALKDSVFKAETASKIAEYKTLYSTEKKEKENKLLQQQNMLQQSKIQSRNIAIVGLLVGVLMIIIFLFWRVSVVNLKKKQRELEATQLLQKEKERISRDLHDNVGGQLSYVLYSIEGVNIDNKEKRFEVVSDISESVRSVISNLRETIWAINDEAISVNDLSDKLKVYVRTMFRNTQTKIVFSERIENNIQLNSFAGLNLYRICQEIVNNAFKHAKATEFSIKIISEERIVITLSDNGIGFKLNEFTENGFGLSNIQNRAAETNISLDVKAMPGNGTIYKLIV